MINYKNKKITIFGLGKSGIEAAKKLSGLKARVLITEKKKKDKINPEVIEELQAIGVNFEFGGHTLYSISGADLIVVSPGVHLDHPVLEIARKHRILIISEIELAYRFLKKPIIAVTGTNGKTTTVTLISEILKQAGKNVALAGNVGTPLITIDDKELDFIIVEISSYQLESILTFRPWISIILNIAPDHIERHQSIDEYSRAKSRIFMNQGKTDYIIYNASDPIVAQMIDQSIAQKIPFKATDIFFNPDDIKLKGEHNFENILAASYTARLSGLNNHQILDTLKKFSGIPHRIELIRNLEGISFYNDSKATNPDSTIKALRALSRDSTSPDIILILGGVDKGLPLSLMIDEIKKYVKDVVLIGAAAQRFNHELINQGFTRIHFGEDLQDAVNKSYEIARQGDQILLSPACSSFDMFSNFEERGQVFRQAALKL